MFNPEAHQSTRSRSANYEPGVSGWALADHDPDAVEPGVTAGELRAGLRALAEVAEALGHIADALVVIATSSAER